MVRVVALNAIFFLLPFIGYAGWLYATRGTFNDSADWPLRRIGVLAAIGSVMMLLGVVSFVSFTGAPPGKTYVPARIEDGVLIPGHFE